MTFIHNDSRLKQYQRNLRSESTPQEVFLWNQLKNSNLGYKFRRQASIQNYIVDFYCPTKRLVTELDGSQHIESIKDEVRDKVLKDFGCTILRFWNNDINTNMEGILLKIQS